MSVVMGSLVKREIVKGVWVLHHWASEVPVLFTGVKVLDPVNPQYTQLVGSELVLFPDRFICSDSSVPAPEVDVAILWSAYLDEVGGKDCDEWRTFVVFHGGTVFTCVWTPHMLYNEKRVHVKPHGSRSLDCEIGWLGDAQITWHNNEKYRPKTVFAEVYSPYPNDKFVRYRLTTNLTEAVRAGMLAVIKPEERQAFAAKILAEGLVDKDRHINYLRAIIPYWQANVEYRGIGATMRSENVIGHDFTSGRKQLDLYLADFLAVSGREYSSSDALTFEDVTRPA